MTLDNAQKNFWKRAAMPWWGVLLYAILVGTGALVAEDFLRTSSMEVKVVKTESAVAVAEANRKMAESDLGHKIAKVDSEIRTYANVAEDKKAKSAVNAIVQTALRVQMTEKRLTLEVRNAEDRITQKVKNEGKQNRQEMKKQEEKTAAILKDIAADRVSQMRTNSFANSGGVEIN